MHEFRWKSIQDREKKARDEAPGLHPCIVHMDEDEREKFMEQFYLTDGSGHAHDEDTLHAFADLVVSPDCADTSFMLVMDRTERGYQNPDKLTMLRKYEPVTQHILSCVSSILDISQDESLVHMLMACVQQKLK